MKKTAIIGGGISGISLARMLHQKDHGVTVLEKESTIGGLIRCKKVNGNLFHTVGGHVFNTKNEEVNQWFWQFFDRNNEFISAKRNAKIWIQGKFLGYPLENYLYQLDEADLKIIISDLLHLSRQKQRDPLSYSNFEDFLRGNFGETLYRLYFNPYNTKIWQTDLKDIAMEWLDGKLPMPDLMGILMSNIQRKEEGSMVHSTFFYPKKDGSQFIINRLAEGLNIKTSYAVEQIVRRDGSYWINNEIEVDKVVYTGDIRRIPSLLSHPEIAFGQSEKIVKLRSNGTSNLFCYCEPNDLSWLYIPEAAYRSHRIIYTGNFSINNNEDTSRPTCVVEFSGHVSYEEMVNEALKLPGIIAPIDSNYQPNSYVVQDQHSRKLITEYKRMLAEKEFYLLGRFAEWEYYNMDKAIEASMKLNIELKKH